MIMDGSVLLTASIPDEYHPNATKLVREHVSSRVHLKALMLLPYELNNAVWQAERRGRINRNQADRMIESFASLDIELFPMEWGESLPLARRFGRSAYDAAYLTLAEQLGEQLVTGDLRLYNAVHPVLGWVLWVGDYTPTE